jgi:hypothetical protein
LKIAPRNILKDALKDESRKISTQVQFSFILNKLKDSEKDKEPHPVSNKGMLTLDSNYGEFIICWNSNLIERLDFS